MRKTPTGPVTQMVCRALDARQWRRISLAFAAVLTMAAPAHAHWCNSGARLTNIERAICSDGNLINKDIELNRLYSVLGGNGNNSLKAAQKGWMNGRNRCTSMSCLHSYYDNRLRVLRTMTGVPAAPVARPVPTYTPPPVVSAPPPTTSAPSSSGGLEKLPDIKPF